MRIDVNYMHFVSWFWDAREFCGNSQNVLTPDILRQWSEHNGIVLEKWERDLMFSMDRAFRHAYNDVVSWHANRPQINNEKDKDRGRKWRT